MIFMSTISMTQNSVALQNETPMVCGLTADNNNKLYMDYDLLME